MNVANTFFKSNDITFISKLKTFIKSNKSGYYIDIFIPEKYVVSLMREGIVPSYSSGTLDFGFYLRCRVKSDSKILCNGRELKCLSEELANQNEIDSRNTKIKVIELSPYSKKFNDTQCSIIRASFTTTIQSLPKEF